MQMDLHKIPNVAILKIEDRHVSRLFLPAIFNEKMIRNAEERKVPIEILRDLYLIMRTVLVDLQPAEAGHLSATYDAEVTRQSRGGQIAPGNSTHLIPAHLLVRFSKDVLQAVRALQWGRGAFWFDQFRGLRGANVSTFDELPDSVEDIFQRLHIPIVPGANNWADWRFDVAVEMQMKGQVMQWRRDSFPMLVEKLLLMSPADAEALVETEAFKVDLSAQLTQVAGFRYEASDGEVARHGVHYCQAYSSEKHSTYQSGADSNSLTMSFADVVRNGGDLYCKKVLKVFTDTALQLDSTWNARLEIRVSGDKYAEIKARLRFTPTELAQSLFSTATKMWFCFKSLRLVALCDLIMFWYSSPNWENRCSEDALHLVLACIWSVNALNSRPVDFVGERQLADSVCPHRLVRTGEWQPERDFYGIHFFAAISVHMGRNDGVAFFPMANMTMEDLQRVAGNEVALSTLRTTLTKRTVGSASSGVGAAASGPPTKKARTTTNRTPAPTVSRIPAGDEENLFDLDEQGIQVANVPSLNDKATWLLYQFMRDVANKFVDAKKGPSYTRNDLQEMNAVHYHQIFSRSNTADVFRVVAYAPASTAAFQSAWDAFWPHQHLNRGQGNQNWSQFLYLKEWDTLRTMTTAADWQAIHSQMWQVCKRRFAWLPLPGDRAWTSRQRSVKGEITIRSDTAGFSGPCPIIVLNPHFTKTQDFIPEVALALKDW
jgi:hypothetical protein